MILFRFTILSALLLGVTDLGNAQMVSSGTVKGPRVSAPTQRGKIPQKETAAKANTRPPSLLYNLKVEGAYPWKTDITATVFWIGEMPTQNNPVPNNKSSWDTAWQNNFGGYDDPDVSKRCVVNYVPRGFVPRQNPFYVALPYNDVVNSRTHKPEAARVIPWFQRDFVRPGKSVCKGKWVQILYKGKYCYAQWEDCGPFNTEDWAYVFGNSPPKNKSNKGAGIDISPAVRDYLGIKSGEKVDWRFVEFARIPPNGPWARYGDNNPFVKRQADPRQLRRQQQIQRFVQIRDKEAGKTGVNRS